MGRMLPPPPRLPSGAGGMPYGPVAPGGAPEPYPYGFAGFGAMRGSSRSEGGACFNISLGFACLQLERVKIT